VYAGEPENAPGVENSTSHPPRQVGEAALAVALRFEFGKLLIPPAVGSGIGNS